MEAFQEFEKKFSDIIPEEFKEAAKSTQQKILDLKEKFFPTVELPKEIEIEPELKAHAEEILESVEKLASETLTKITEQLGSNEGGWYQNTETGEKFYIKFYKNPDQARIEFLANRIYGKLGIGAPESELLEMDGQLAIASKEVPGASATYREEQRESPDVRSGFIADAYLANWDVVGLNYDNIVKDLNGKLVRIDNGGSLIFRAQGGLKDFSADSIPELENMLNPNYPAGTVFEGLSAEDMRAQAQELVDKLSPKDIEELVKTAGLSPEVSEKIILSLVGRRNFLIKKWDLKERVKKPRLEKVMHDMERDRTVLELGFRPRESILSDSDHIENQEIDFIDMSEDGYVLAQFKLTASDYERIKSTFGVDYPEDAIVYHPLDRQPAYEKFIISSAWSIEWDGLEIKISCGDRRSSEGLVNIEIPVKPGEQEDLASLEIRIENVLESIFGIEEGIAPPSPEAEKNYKIARYKWHHKIKENFSEEEMATAERLEREEVFPSYFTMVDHGRHLQYRKKFGEFALFHGTSSATRIVSMLKLGLMSSHERFRRGRLVNGMSSEEDFSTGGADSVFLRTITAKILEKHNVEASSCLGGDYALIFDPKLLDRTDWYAYDRDKYGTTDLEEFRSRLSPEELLGRINSSDEYSDIGGNEQMFRTGIAPEGIRGIACIVEGYSDSACIDDVMRNLANWNLYNPDQRFSFTKEELELAWSKGPRALRDFFEKLGRERFFENSVKINFNRRMLLINECEEAGITEINGKPISEFIFAIKYMKEAISIANGENAEN